MGIRISARLVTVMGSVAGRLRVLDHAVTLERVGQATSANGNFRSPGRLATQQSAIPLNLRFSRRTTLHYIRAYKPSFADGCYRSRLDLILPDNLLSQTVCRGIKKYIQVAALIV